MPALKYSRQREAIKQLLMARNDHPTADMVYHSLRSNFPNISLGTVYRNLTLLADLGEISRLRLGDGVDHFDADTSRHYHFVCSRCGSVSDLDMEFPEALDRLNGPDAEGNVIEGHVAYFYGICSRCRKQSSA
ncbi:MAG: transcriptional repressor [Eubacteriales bacterium]|nr:transcriptional repressor [Eubacteriales bacterium]